MNAAVDLNSQADRLVSLVDAENPFDLPFSELLPRQLEAINERFKDRVEKIKLLQNRAETGGITEIRRMADIVPLLFAHTAYKSYPEGWLIEEKWDRLGRWLDTVSSQSGRADGHARRSKASMTGCSVSRTRHHYVSCSSGTTGKCAMMNATMADLRVLPATPCCRRIIWAGLAPNHDRRMISLGQGAATPRNRATGRPMREAFNRPDVAPFVPKVPPITIGGITEMVVLRKKIAEGTAKPTEIAYFEAQAAAREKAIESAVEQAADALIESRHMKLHIMGLFGPMYQGGRAGAGQGLQRQGLLREQRLHQRRTEARASAAQLSRIHLRDPQSSRRDVSAIPTACRRLNTNARAARPAATTWPPGSCCCCWMSPAKT